MIIVFLAFWQGFLLNEHGTQQKTALQRLALATYRLSSSDIWRVK